MPPGALITAVTLPAAPVAARSTYRKVRERASYAFANGSVAAALDVRDGRVRDVRLAFGAVPVAARSRRPTGLSPRNPLGADRALESQHVHGIVAAARFAALHLGKRCAVEDARYQRADGERRRAATA
jgi:xanthine dehydrogenase iron-sulfur cluster and FAD-binding subunit A